jgi:hypothetical protein
MERHDEQSGHYVKRVQLPSGKTIEVVYFRDAELAAADRPADPSDVPSHALDMHICQHCDSELVNPISWDEEPGAGWRVTLRCPDCETQRHGVFSESAVDHFDEVLEAGSDALASDYRKLMRANMADEADRFAHAIASDAILPEDF